MKRQLFRFTFFLLMCLTLLLSTTAQAVDIPDANLRAAIEAALGKASGDTITASDMTNLTDLTARNAGISNLTGLEHATNLKSLWLDGEEVRPGVWENSNSVSDLSPLAGLTQLEALDFWQNSVSDISALAGLTNLTHLGLVGNNISDVSVLTGLTNLESLWLDGNPIADISPLAGLTQLTRLGLDNTSISDISALAGLTNLTWMRMERNNISDLSPLVANTGLGEGDEVHVRGNPLNRASIKTHVPALEGRGVMVEFDDVVAELVDIPDPNLRAAIERNLGKASGAIITTVDMATLLHLEARNANISDLTGLEAATNLTFLILDTNSITDISAVSGLTNLESLNLRNNSISDLSAVSGLTSLTFLILDNNNVSDLSPLVENTGLGSGGTVSLWENPLSEASINTHIPALQSRGVTVEFIQTPTLLLKISGTVTELDNLLIVEVRDNRNFPFEGVPVTFTVISGGGVLSVTNTTTDANGRAESRLTLGPDAGTNTVRASVEGISQTVTFSDVPEPPVDIPDPNLRAAIEAQLDKASGDLITASEMARMTGGLAAPNANISDLTGLEFAINLAFLHLGAEYLEAGGRNINSNSVSDISPLADLTNLEFLILEDNSISDISPLAGLTNLEFLILSNNTISDISVVAGLTNLTGLSLEGNSVSDISAVARLTNLTSLGLGNNAISDISAVVGLTNLTFLGLDNNAISDISAVAGLTNLRFLLLADNSISDLSPLVENMGLGEEDWVDVQRNPLSFLSIYTHIPALQSREAEVGFDQVPVLSGHNDGVVSVAFSRDGTLASGGQDGTVILRDAITEQPIATLTVHTASARSVAFSPDGSILASGSHDGTVILWDTATEQLNILTEHTAPVETVAFSRDGSTLASGSHDGMVILWDVATGQPKDTIMGHANRVWSLAFSPDGTLAIGRDDGTILLWDVATGQPKDTLTGHTAWVESVAFNRDGSTLASGSGDNTVILWEVATGRPIAILPGHTAGVNSVAFSPDGTILASGSDDSTVRLWDAVMGEPIATLTGHTSWVRSVAFSPDGTTLASGSGDTTVRLWEIGLPTLPEYTLSIPVGISLIHVPLKVTEVDGVAKTIESISDLYDVLGGADTVNFLITYDSQAQEWRSYFVSSDKGTPADRGLTDDMGILADLRAPASIQLRGDPLGTNGSSAITLNQGLNLVGLPLRDSRVTRVSDLLALEGIGGNVPVIILTDDGEFKLVGRASDPGDIPITGGQAFIMTTQRAATVTISGDGWDNTATIAAAPSLSLKGIEVGDTTPVLGLRGAIVDEGMGLKVPNFRVTVKNLSTGRAVTSMTREEGVGYRLTVVDIETGRAATIGDILEISARSPNPFIGVQSLQYTVTAEDVKRSLIQLPELVTYEIPSETQLLRNYPNPFNPETWIPYRLAEDAFVTLIIYDQTGHVVRTLDVGHQVAAVYESRSKAVYWDGRNNVGERVASGVYFYHLSAGDFSATRKMLILK